VTNDQTPTQAGAEVFPATVSLRESFWTWCRVALLSFGGPAGQIAVMHRILVDEKKWISEERFLHALNYCMLLPGPEAQQLAIYIGWLMHLTLGGLVAGVLFVLPGFVSILALSIVYACYEEFSIVQALFFGLKPAVMAIVIAAVFRIGKRVLKNSTMVTLAAAAFVAIFFFDVPFPVLIVSMSSKVTARAKIPARSLCRQITSQRMLVHDPRFCAAFMSVQFG
jgi:chromate transporter